MIDHVTLGIHGDDAAIVRNHPGLEWCNWVNLSTAEEFTAAIVHFGPIRISYKGPRYVWISGSLHHLWNHLRGYGKVNWDQFGYGELIWTIDQLAQIIGLPASKMILRTIEIGLNLENPPFPVSGTVQAVILHKNKPFKLWNSGNGKQAVYGQYELKIYDKGKQSHLGKKWQAIRQILRIELKVKKMQHLEGLGVQTLEDLKEPEPLNALFERLHSHLHHVTIVEPPVTVSALIKPSEREFWGNATYLEYWQRLPSRRIRYQKGKVERIMLEAGTQSLKQAFLDESWKVFRERMDLRFFTL